MLSFAKNVFFSGIKVVMNKLNETINEQNEDEANGVRRVVLHC